MNNEKRNWTIGAIIGLILISLLVWGLKQQNAGPGDLDDFATCLGTKGAIFYGAFWCPHCQEQKSWFGKSVTKLPYVECSTPDGQGQTQVCIDKKIMGYPTWIFADGTRIEREVPLQELADKTGCLLPGATASSSTTSITATSTTSTTTATLNFTPVK